MLKCPRTNNLEGGKEHGQPHDVGHIQILESAHPTYGALMKNREGTKKTGPDRIVQDAEPQTRIEAG